MQKTRLLALFFLCCFGISTAAIDVNNSFLPASMYPGQVSRLTIKIQNSAAVPATGVAFTNNLPAGLFIAGSGNLSNDGGGSFTVSNGPSFGTLVLSGATIPANGLTPGLLTLAVDVTSPTQGNYTNVFPVNSVTGTTTIPNSNPQPSSATLVVIVQANDGGATWTYTPVSAGGGATTGYDRSVINVRVVYAGQLQIAETVNLTFTTIIR